LFELGWLAALLAGQIEEVGADVDLRALTHNHMMLDEDRRPRDLIEERAHLSQLQTAANVQKRQDLRDPENAWHVSYGLDVGLVLPHLPLFVFLDAVQEEFFERLEALVFF